MQSLFDELKHAKSRVLRKQSIKLLEEASKGKSEGKSSMDCGLVFAYLKTEFYKPDGTKDVFADMILAPAQSYNKTKVGKVIQRMQGYRDARKTVLEAAEKRTLAAGLTTKEVPALIELFGIYLPLDDGKSALFPSRATDPSPGQFKKDIKQYQGKQGKPLFRSLKKAAVLKFSMLLRLIGSSDDTDITDTTEEEDFDKLAAELKAAGMNEADVQEEIRSAREALEAVKKFSKEDKAALRTMSESLSAASTEDPPISTETRVVNLTAIGSLFGQGLADLVKRVRDKRLTPLRDALNAFDRVAWTAFYDQHSLEFEEAGCEALSQSLATAEVLTDQMSELLKTMEEEAVAVDNKAVVDEKRRSALKAQLESLDTQAKKAIDDFKSRLGKKSLGQAFDQLRSVGDPLATKLKDVSRHLDEYKNALRLFLGKIEPLAGTLPEVHVLKLVEHRNYEVTRTQAAESKKMAVTLGTFAQRHKALELAERQLKRGVPEIMERVEGFEHAVDLARLQTAVIAGRKELESLLAACHATQDQASSQLDGFDQSEKKRVSLTKDLKKLGRAPLQLDDRIKKAHEAHKRGKTDQEATELEVAAVQGVLSKAITDAKKLLKAFQDLTSGIQDPATLELPIDEKDFERAYALMRMYKNSLVAALATETNTGNLKETERLWSHATVLKAEYDAAKTGLLKRESRKKTRQKATDDLVNLMSQLKIVAVGAVSTLRIDVLKRYNSVHGLLSPPDAPSGWDENHPGLGQVRELQQESESADTAFKKITTLLQARAFLEGLETSSRAATATFDDAALEARTALERADEAFAAVTRQLMRADADLGHLKDGEKRLSEAHRQFAKGDYSGSLKTLSKFEKSLAKPKFKATKAAFGPEIKAAAGAWDKSAKRAQQEVERFRKTLLNDTALLDELGGKKAVEKSLKAWAQSHKKLLHTRLVDDVEFAISESVGKAVGRSALDGAVKGSLLGAAIGAAVGAARANASAETRLVDLRRLHQRAADQSSELRSAVLLAQPLEDSVLDGAPFHTHKTPLAALDALVNALAKTL